MRTFREEDFAHKGEAVPKEQFELFRANFTGVCTDIMILEDRPDIGKVAYLAYRKAGMVKGDQYWVIGGLKFVGDTLAQAAAKKFAKETGLTLDPERFTLLPGGPVILQIGGSDPREDNVHTFTVWLSPEERAEVMAGLDENEYNTHKGLSAFNSKRIDDALGLDPYIREFYHIATGQKDAWSDGTVFVTKR